jgi:hypothetical protein
LTRVGVLGAPRPIPRRRWAPPLGGALVIALALPLFLVVGWSLAGWAIAALLWLGMQAFGLLLGRLNPSAALGFGLMLRMLVVLVVLVAVAASDQALGLAAALVYGAAYTVELTLSLAAYYGQEPTA